MQQFEIKGLIATFGVGMVLELTDEQAEARKDNLTKKGKYYVVSEPVSFKQGEKLGVAHGIVSKRLLEGLEDLEKKEQTPPSILGAGEFPLIKHMGFGKYDVFDKEGLKLTDKPIAKADAEKMLEDLKKEE